MKKQSGDWPETIIIRTLILGFAGGGVFCASTGRGHESVGLFFLMLVSMAFLPVVRLSHRRW